MPPILQPHRRVDDEPLGATDAQVRVEEDDVFAGAHCLPGVRGGVRWVLGWLGGTRMWEMDGMGRVVVRLRSFLEEKGEVKGRMFRFRFFFYWEDLRPGYAVTIN